MTNQHFKPATPPLDRRGKEIKVGDFIAYAVSNSSSAALRLARVVELVKRGREYIVTSGQRDATGAYVPPVRGDEEYYKVKVQPCNPDGEPTSEYEMVPDSNTQHGWRRQDTGKPVRKVTLEFSDRAVVIPD